MTNVLKKIKSRLQLSRDQLRRSLGRVLFDRPNKNILPIVQPKKIVFVRWDAKLGDSIVSSWIFPALKKQYPGSSIEVVTSPSMAWLFKEHFGVDIVHKFPKRANYKQLASLAKQLGQVDLLVHFGQQLKMKDIYFIRCISARYVAGLDDALQCINIKLGEKTAGQHFCHKFARLAEVCGVINPNMTYLLPEDEQSQHAVTCFWPEKPVVAINPFGSSQSRRLTADNIIQLLHILDNTLPPDIRFCLLFSPEKKKDIISLCNQLPRTFCYPESSTITDIISQIKKSCGLISVDTATIHIAAALKKPILGLYNYDLTNFAEWGPNASNSKVLFSEQCMPPDINKLPWLTLSSHIKEWWQTIKNHN